MLTYEQDTNVACCFSVLITTDYKFSFNFFRFNLLWTFYLFFKVQNRETTIRDYRLQYMTFENLYLILFKNAQLELPSYINKSKTKCICTNTIILITDTEFAST